MRAFIITAVQAVFFTSLFWAILWTALAVCAAL